jgi:hypothetical protein
MFAGLKETLDGEWVPKEGKYYAFDMPDEPGDHDQRCRTLVEFASRQIRGLVIMDHYEANFAEVYVAPHAKRPRALSSNAAPATTPSNAALQQRHAIGSSAASRGTSFSRGPRTAVPFATHPKCVGVSTEARKTAAQPAHLSMYLSTA